MEPDLPRLRKARPARFRITVWDVPAAGSIALDLPKRRGMRAVGIVIAIFFVVFAAVLVIQISQLTGGRETRDVFDLTFWLFGAFWALGWSAGVLILGALTLLLLGYGESARIERGHLVYVPRLGPLKFIAEYELAQMRNLRTEPARGNNPAEARVRFDYDGGAAGIGDAMPQGDAERIITRIRSAAPVMSAPRKAEPAASAPALATTPLPRIEPVLPVPHRSPMSLAGWTLIAANLVPLVGVFAGRWGIAEVMVLYWSESAVIGFYTVLKMVVVGKWLALFTGPFFVGHFGGFMAAHFLFVYAFFVRGVDERGPGPPVLEALREIFVPLWPALAALVVSHGVSFAVNFVGRREHAGAELSGLMAAPYKRIFIMHLTILFGGWLVLALKTPVPALVLLIMAKIAIDFRAHKREHAQTPARI